MKQITIVAVCLIIAFIAADAGAQDTDSGWQIGGSVVTSEFERDDGLIDNNSFGFRLHTQYRFNSWLGLEGTYYNSGDFETDALTPQDKVEIDYQGIQAQGIVYIPFPVEKMELFIKGGYFDFDVDSVVAGDNSGSGSDSGAVLGTGLTLGITDSMNIRAEFDWYDTAEAELWTVGLGLEYHF